MDIITSNGRKAQLDDVAKALGISKTTVSRAISGKGRVSAATRKRVLDCIKEMNYSPNMIAKSFSENKTYNIGVVIPMDNIETEAPFFQTCLMSISKCCALRSYDTLVIGTEKNDLSQLRRVLESGKTDGIIITRPLQDGSMEQLISEYNMPCVAVGQSTSPDAVLVDSAHKEGCGELTSYLLMNNSAQNIGLILGDMGQTVNRSRYEGYVKALENTGNAVPEKTVYLGVNGEMQLRRVIEELTQNGCTCIICGDDMICMHAVNMLNSMGKAIPRDMRIASFYNSMYLDMNSPPITALRFRAEDLGAASVSMLLDMLEGRNTERETVLGFEMLIRRSTM
ncbi:MAG: LacI family DNA-binding transcriptional regulator [Ruminiclostridium sp.]|nr:LacI family DNA-binding transcriptional regulator [Ruminiclostridium sp.]